VICIRRATKIYDSQHHRHQQKHNEREFHQVASLLALKALEADCCPSRVATEIERPKDRYAASPQSWSTLIVDVFEKAMDVGIPG
jgi:hypothetical protein